MKVSNTMVIGLVALCALQAGLLLSPLLGTSWAAADDVVAPADAALFPGRLLCKTFAADPAGPALIMPGDKSEAGNWVQEQSNEWQIYTVDFEMATKSTGFPQGWLQVCLAPR
jgi:hypothetical protein